MNLTSKRALQFMTMCAGVCALSASAQTTWVADNFEPEGAGYTNAAIGSAIGTYKMYKWGGPSESYYTNIVWEAVAGDASTIIANTDSYGDMSPMESSTDSQFLKLETEGQTLTRYVDFVVTNETTGQTGPTNVSFATAPVYVDTLIKFTPSEDAPEISDPNVKIAIFVNVNSNLVVRHKFTNGETFITTNSVFENLGVLNPEQWHRLTIMLAYNDTENDPAAFYNPAFEIWMDGSKLTHANGAVSTTVFTGGSWFFSLVDGATTLSQVSFQGTGSVDELVVSDVEPTFGVPPSVMLTLSFDTSMIDVTTNGISVADDVLVPSDAAIVISAKPWYEITNPGTYFVGGNTTNKVAGTEMITNINGIVTSTTAVTNTIAATLYSSTSGISTGLGGSYPADKVAAWAIASGLTPDQLTDAMKDNYLLNIDESIDADIEITSIVIDDVNSIATIKVKATDLAVDFTDLNGELVVWTSDDLTAWGEPTSYPFVIQSTSATEVEIDIPYAAGNFIKARVE